MTDRPDRPPSAGVSPDGRLADPMPAVDAAVPSPGGDDPDRYASRRRLLKWLIRIGTGTFALAFALPALALRSLTQATKDVAAGDLLVIAPTTPGATAGQPVKLADLAEGEGVQVFPDGKEENSNNLIELVKVGPDRVVAYSAICTHLGCAVFAGLNQEGLVHCPCHGSLFDPRADAAVVAGPAPRPLPSLPVEVDADGNLVAAGGFSGPVGVV